MSLRDIDLSEVPLIDELEIRRKRALYRAQHRGTKEMDLLVGRYAAATLPRLDADGVARFERFLSVQDPVLEAWIFGKDDAAATEFAGFVSDVRAFHGLGPARGGDTTDVE